nr:MAG TPA: 43 kDa tail protein [Caudoviricetes sp.]
MINVTEAYKEAIKEDRIFDLQDKIILKDDTEIPLIMSDVLAYSINSATSSDSTFDVGSVVAAKLSLTIDNTDERFEDVDLTDARISTKIGLLVEDSFEYVTKGIFYINSAQDSGDTIVIEAYDKILFLDLPYAESTLAYPATIREILQEACTHCGITLDTTTIGTGANYIVNSRPATDSLTFRDIVSYCGKILGKYAYISADQKLKFAWYEKSNSPYEITEQSSLTKNRSSMTITGARFGYTVTTVKEGESEPTEENKTAFVGTEGYVLTMEDNPLIQTEDMANKVMNILKSSVVGTTIRVYSLSCLSDPTIEAGDSIKVTDRKGRSFESFITNCTFTLCGNQELSLGAETESENQYQRFSISDKIVARANQNNQIKINDYNTAMQRLTDLMMNSFGVFKTEEKQKDGSTTFYLHDKKTLKESIKIWKMTADAFSVSSDGGKTWNAGLDSSGNAVVNVLSAIGIDFSWAKGGTLNLGGAGNGNGVLKVTNASGDMVGMIDKSGINAYRGTFGGWIIDGDKLYQDAIGVDGYTYRVYFQPVADPNVNWMTYIVQRRLNPTDKWENIFYVTGDGEIYGKGYANIGSNLGVGGDLIVKGAAQIENVSDIFGKMFCCVSVVVNESPVAIYVPDGYIPIAAINADWNAYPDTAFDIVRQGGFNLLLTRNLKTNAASSGNYVTGSGGGRRANVLFINRKFISGYDV